jgi:ssDNA-binding Zn-finger/Zn-ribbon topoisomerase 1
MDQRLCVVCKKPIAAERLEAAPEATRCVKCQSSAEAPGDPRRSGETCPRCRAKGIQSMLVWRRARDPEISGEFLGCSRYPHCQYIDRS